MRLNVFKSIELNKRIKMEEEAKNDSGDEKENAVGDRRKAGQSKRKAGQSKRKACQSKRNFEVNRTKQRKRRTLSDTN
jgi:hypothetical protein